MLNRQLPDAEADTFTERVCSVLASGKSISLALFISCILLLGLFCRDIAAAPRGAGKGKRMCSFTSPAAQRDAASEKTRRLGGLGFLQAACPNVLSSEHAQ